MAQLRRLLGDWLGTPSPKRVQEKILRQIKSQAQHLDTSGVTLLCGTWNVRLSPREYDAIASSLSQVQRELERNIRQVAAEESWKVAGERVRIQLFRGEELPLGKMELRAREPDLTTEVPNNFSSVGRTEEISPNYSGDASRDLPQASPTDPTAMCLMDLETGTRMKMPEGRWVTLGHVGSGADLEIGGSAVSRKHLELKVWRGLGRPGLMVRDCHSSNGTKIDQRPLAPGSEVLVRLNQKILIAGTHELLVTEVWAGN